MTEKWKIVTVNTGASSYFSPNECLDDRPTADLTLHLFPSANIKRFKSVENYLELIRLLLSDGWEPFAVFSKGVAAYYVYRKRVEG